MYLRALLPVEHTPRNGSHPASCFLCHAKAGNGELYRCTEPMRAEWTACLRCARSTVRPDPWKRRA